jgi:murein DD-endopeptidase MepM/ murein hydrolase activator NlpD
VRSVLTALCLLAALLSAGTGVFAQPDPERELDRVREELEAARQGLADLENREALSLADLQSSDARRVEIEAELARKEEELARAEDELARAEERLAETTEQLTETRRRLSHTRVRLALNRDEFKARARVSYMYGGVGDAPTHLLEVSDVAELGRAIGYMRTVLDGDRIVVDTIEELEAQVDRDARALDRLQERQTQQRAEAGQQRDEVAGLVTSQRALKAEADAEVEHHRLILAQLESDQQEHQALIASLDAESAQLEAELRAREAARQAAERAPAPAVVGPPAGGGRLAVPCHGRMGSGFGPRMHPIFGTRRMHTGLDMCGGASGEPIFAAEGGVVVSAGPRGGYGNATVIDHGGGMATLYAHQSRIGVSPGQRVSRGQVIGAVGSTGYSTGPHLHFEVRINGSPVDPMGYL